MTVAGKKNQKRTGGYCSNLPKGNFLPQKTAGNATLIPHPHPSKTKEKDFPQSIVVQNISRRWIIF
jgi:hypothetical protein